jgi:Ca2+-binding RTX toxin-like protein
VPKPPDCGVPDIQKGLSIRIFHRYPSRCRNNLGGLAVVVKGTKNPDVLEIKFGDTVTALGGADTINVVQADPNFGVIATPYGLIDGGTGIDTLVLKEPAFSGDWTYTFSNVIAVEKLKFTNEAFLYDSAQFLVTVPGSATGTVIVGPVLAIEGSAGGNDVTYKVTGGMGSASAITLPRLTFISFDPSATLAASFSDDTVALIAGDSSNYVLKASDAIGTLGLEQDIIGNAGNDKLIGSVGTDWLVGHAGADTMYGKSGDDVFSIFGSDQPESGDLFDGGLGTDFLYIGRIPAPLTFAGTLVSIEGIYLASTAELLITADQMTMLPAALKISGSSAAKLNITDAKTFSAANFTFSDELDPTIAINGTAGADTLTGSSRGDVLKGAGGADRLIGGAGNDALHGGLGSDTLTGGSGSDTFVFGAVTKSAARDTITDFRSFQGDKISLDKTGFAGITLTDGIWDPGIFYAARGARSAHDANDRLIYDTANGLLYYDADGLGGQASVAIALLKDAPTLTAADILIL